MSPVTTKQRLRELATLRPDGHKVLSLYLNLDPSEFPTPKHRRTELESLLDVVERAVRDDGLPHEQKRGAAARRRADPDLVHERVRRQRHARRGRVRLLRHRPVRRPPAGPADPQRGHDRRLAVHRAAGRHARRRRLRRAADQPPARAHPGRRPRRACARSSASSTTCTAGTTRAAGRRRASSAGSRRRPRTTSSTPSDELFKLFKRGVAQRLIIGCPDEMRGEVEHTLHSYLRERIAGWLDIDVKAQPGRGRARGGRDHRARRARPRAPLARPPAERAGAPRARGRGPGGHARGAQRAARRGAAGGQTASAPRATRRRAADFLSRGAGQLAHR